jgi:hypothetical protein
MTVCIAAIAAESEAIVCIADRALTFAGLGASAQTDSGLTKIVDIPNTRWCAMFSSDDLTFPERVLGLVEADIAKCKRNECDRKEMEASVKKAFETRWNAEVEDQVLKPNLLSIASFTPDDKKKDLRLLDSKFINTLSQAIADYKHDCSMLFCGFDPKGPYIFSASTPCRIDPCDWQGFQAIGAGEETARNHLIFSEYARDDSLESVLYDVFNAKCATEVLQGIGYEWDWRVIIPGSKPKPLPKRISQLIDRAWTMNNRAPFADKLPKKERPTDWKRRLSKFADELLTTAQSSKKLT